MDTLRSVMYKPYYTACTSFIDKRYISSKNRSISISGHEDPFVDKGDNRYHLDPKYKQYDYIEIEGTSKILAKDTIHLYPCLFTLMIKVINTYKISSEGIIEVSKDGYEIANINGVDPRQFRDQDNDELIEMLRQNLIMDDDNDASNGSYETNISYIRKICTYQSSIEIYPIERYEPVSLFNGITSSYSDIRFI